MPTQCNHKAVSTYQTFQGQIVQCEECAYIFNNGKRHYFNNLTVTAGKDTEQKWLAREIHILKYGIFKYLRHGKLRVEFLKEKHAYQIVYMDGIGRSEATIHMWQYEQMRRDNGRFERDLQELSEYLRRTMRRMDKKTAMMEKLKPKDPEEEEMERSIGEYWDNSPDRYVPAKPSMSMHQLDALRQAMISPEDFRKEYMNGDWLDIEKDK